MTEISCVVKLISPSNIGETLAMVFTMVALYSKHFAKQLFKPMANTEKICIFNGFANS